MAVTAPRFLLYSRWGQQLGELSVLSATCRQEINGEDALDLEVTQPLSKGDRILWTDGAEWSEHVVSSESQAHDGGESFSASCVWALQADLRGRHVREWMARGVTCEEAVSTLLETTSWGVGTLEGEGTADFDFEAASVYECLLQVAGAFGLELEQVLALSGAGVTSRSVSMLKESGAFRGARFDYGHGLTGVTKEVLDTDVITACYGYGRSSGDSRLWCYVTDDEALQTWGVPGPDGEPTHVDGVFEDPSIESQSALEEATSAHLAAHCVPDVSYAASIPIATLRGVRIGDTVHVVDRDFTPELRLEARVGELTRDVLRREATSATFGTVVSVLPDVLARSYSASVAALRAAGEVDPDAIVGRVDQKLAAEGATVKEVVISDVGSGTLAIDEGGALLWNGEPLAASGTGDYEALSNKPSIGGVTLVGDRELDELGAVAMTNGEIEAICK